MLRLPPNALRARESPRGRPNEQRYLQIGPRIRVGGTVGRIGQNVKQAVVKGAVDTGHAIGDAANNQAVKAAIAAGLIATGAGAPLGAAILGGTGLVGGLTSRGGGLKRGLVGGAEGALEGGVAGKVGSAVGGVKGILSHLGVGGGADDGADADPSLSGATDTSNGDDGGLLGTAKKIGGAVLGGTKTMLGNGNNSGRSSLVDQLLLGAGVAASAADKKRQMDMQNKAADYATSSYDTRAPLRTQGQAQILNPTTPDLSSTFQDPGNPYTKGVTLGSKVPLRVPSY